MGLIRVPGGWNVRDGDTLEFSSSNGGSPDAAVAILEGPETPFFPPSPGDTLPGAGLVIEGGQWRDDAFGFDDVRSNKEISGTDYSYEFPTDRPSTMFVMGTASVPYQACDRATITSPCIDPYVFAWRYLVAANGWEMIARIDSKMTLGVPHFNIAGPLVINDWEQGGVILARRTFDPGATTFPPPFRLPSPQVDRPPLAGLNRTRVYFRAFRVENGSLTQIRQHRVRIGPGGSGFIPNDHPNPDAVFVSRSRSALQRTSPPDNAGFFRDFLWEAENGQSGWFYENNTEYPWEGWLGHAVVEPSLP